MKLRRIKSQSSARWIISNRSPHHRNAPGFPRGRFLASYHPPTVAGFFMPFPCGGSSGVLSGLFFGGILFHPGILSACVSLPAPSLCGLPGYTGDNGYWHLCMPCTGRFPGVASCTTSGILCRPGQCGIVDSRRPFSKFYSRSQSRKKVATIVAKKTPESRKTSGGFS